MPTRLCARADAPEAVRPRPSVLLAGRATDARRNARCSWPLTNLAMHPRRGCARGFFRRALASLHKAHVQGARRMHCAMAQRGILTSLMVPLRRICAAAGDCATTRRICRARPPASSRDANISAPPFLSCSDEAEVVVAVSLGVAWRGRGASAAARRRGIVQGASRVIE